MALEARESGTQRDANKIAVAGFGAQQHTVTEPLQRSRPVARRAQLVAATGDDDDEMLVAERGEPFEARPTDAVGVIDEDQSGFGRVGDTVHPGSHIGRGVGPIDALDGHERTTTRGDGEDLE